MARIGFDVDEFVPLCTEVVAEVGDVGSADLFASLLEEENVHSTIHSVGLFLGLSNRYRILVDPRQLHRAHWILRETEFSDRELAYLATGVLEAEDEVS